MRGRMKNNLFFFFFKWELGKDSKSVDVVTSARNAFLDTPTNRGVAVQTIDFFRMEAVKRSRFILQNDDQTSSVNTVNFKSH